MKQRLFGGMLMFLSAFMLGGCSLTPTASVQAPQAQTETVTTADTTTGMEAKDTEVPRPTTPKKNIVVIFDASGSMNEMLNGEKKIDIAKRSLNAYIDSLPSDVNLSLLSYGETGSNSTADKAKSCGTIEEKYYLGPVNGAVAKNKVNAILAKGWTPIANALNKADAILAAHPGEENRIVLVSDGQETCDGNPVAAAQKVKADNAKVDVLGFNVTGAAAEQLKNISVQGGGGYVSIKTADDFSVVIKDGTINAITPDSMVSVGADGNLSVQNDAGNVKMDNGALETTSGDMKIKVKPGEMPDISGVPGL